MLLESGLKVSQASRSSMLLQMGSFAGVCLVGGRPATCLAGVQKRKLRTWSKVPYTEGFLRSLEGGSRGISYGGLIKAFQGQILQRLVISQFAQLENIKVKLYFFQQKKSRHEKSSGVGLYSRDGLINPPPGDNHPKHLLRLSLSSFRQDSLWSG